MSLSPEEKEDMEEMESRGRIRRKAVANDMKLWPRGIVYYQLSSTLGLFSFVQLMNEEFSIILLIYSKHFCSFINKVLQIHSFLRKFLLKIIIILLKN